MTLFTFLTEVAGSTIVEQIEAPTLRDACEIWHRVSLADLEAFRASLFEYINPTAIEDSLNVWCYGGVDKNGRSLLVNVVATSRETTVLGY
jgi:hypothetical protein